MMIFSSIKNGLSSVWSNKRMILVFFFSNFLFGLMLMLPFRAVLSDFVGNSTMGSKLGGRLDMNFLFEFFKHNPQLTDIFTGLILVAGVYWLFSLFLSGGAFAVLASGEKYSGQIFWGGAGKYFGRFFRLVLWSLPVGAIFFALQFIETGVEKLFFGSDPYQNITYWGDWIQFGLRTIAILLFGLVLDYSRIHAVVTDERKMRVSLWHGIKFTFGNLGQTFGLTLILFGIGAVVLLIYSPIANSLAAPNGFVVLLLFLLQQLFMIFRMTLRLTLYASQMNLYQGHGKEEVTVVASGDVGLEPAA